jgi:hypothetical protein
LQQKEDDLTLWKKNVPSLQKEDDPMLWKKNVQSLQKENDLTLWKKNVSSLQKDYVQTRHEAQIAEEVLGLVNQEDELQYQKNFLLRLRILRHCILHRSIHQIHLHQCLPFPYTRDELGHDRCDRYVEFLVYFQESFLCSSRLHSIFEEVFAPHSFWIWISEF